MNGQRALLATAVAAILAVAVSACDRPAADRTSTATPPPTSRAPASPPPAAPAPDRSVGQVIDDAGITAKVKTALAAEKDVSAVKINVDTAQGTVTLSGQVASQTEVDRALRVARGVDGVKSVENRLTVGS